MSHKKPRASYIVSLCGIMCAVSVVMMFFLSMIPAFEYISPMVSGLCLWVVYERLGTKYAMMSYIAVGLLCLFISPNYEATLMFIFLLGHYPITREYLMKLKFALLRWIVKLAVYAVCSIACYWILINLLGMKQLLEDMGEFGQYGPWVLLALGAVAFIMYDIFLGVFKPFYDKAVKPKLSALMK